MSQPRGQLTHSSLIGQYKLRDSKLRDNKRDSEQGTASSPLTDRPAGPGVAWQTTLWGRWPEQLVCELEDLEQVNSRTNVAVSLRRLSGQGNDTAPHGSIPGSHGRSFCKCNLFKLRNGQSLSSRFAVHTAEQTIKHTAHAARHNKRWTMEVVLILCDPV